MIVLSKLFPRYKDYIPLAPHPSSNRLGVGSILLVAAFVASLVLNCVVFVGSRRSWTSPLDDYQSLKQYPLLNPNTSSRALLSVHSSTTNAIVTTLYNNAYAAAVATLGHSLRKVNTTARMVLLYLPDKVSADALCLAVSSGFTPQPVERIAPPDNGRGMNPHFIDQYTKLLLWTLDTSPQPIDTLVYLDSDTLVLRNFDELFSLPYNFAAAPDVYLDARGFTTNFNAGVMLLRPDTALYHQMSESLTVARYPHEMAEQAFLNQFFATDVLRLPYVYNGNIALKERSAAVWEGMQDELRIIHYTVFKPFISHSWEPVPVERLEDRVQAAAGAHLGIFREEMLRWGEMWKETRSTYATELGRCQKTSVKL